MKLLFTISVAIVLRSNATNYCGSTDYGLSDPIDEYDRDNCLDSLTCKPLATPPTVWCASKGACVPYQNDGAHCKQERVHPIPACETIFTQDAVSHAKEKWFFCAAGSEDRSLDTATEVGKCMPPESVHGEVCVNWLKWAFMQALPKTGTCFVNGLESDKDCVKGIAETDTETSYEVKVESGSSTFQVRCAESQDYNPQEFMSPEHEGTSRPKACGNTFYLKLEDSRVNSFLDEYLYCAESAHQWRSTPYTGAPTNAPTHEPTKEPTKEPTMQPTFSPTQKEESCGIAKQGDATFDGDGSMCNEQGYVKEEVCVMERNDAHECECRGTYEYQDRWNDRCCVNGQPNIHYTFDPTIALVCGGEDSNESSTRPTCEIETVRDENLSPKSCYEMCNVGSIHVHDQCIYDVQCDCVLESSNEHDVLCTGPDMTVSHEQDHAEGCSATCWANGVNNSNVQSDERKPFKKVDYWTTCHEVTVDGSFHTDNAVPCNTYSCAKLLANDAGLAVNN